MIIKLVLTAALAFCFFYGLTQKGRSTAISTSVLVVSVLGIYFVWFPQTTSAIAHFMGVGRGTDLVLYVWVILSLVVALSLHLKFNAQLELITELTRHIALREARHEPFLDRGPSTDSDSEGT